MRPSPSILSLALVGTLASGALGQEIPREEYLLQLPLSTPTLVPETDASARLWLFGNPNEAGYRDEGPVDGIDDARHEILMALAVRFAPYLVQNTSDFPLDFDAFISNRRSFPLYVDTWDTNSEVPVLMETRAVNFSALGRAECPTAARSALDESPDPTDDGALEDCKILQLMDRYTPGANRTRILDESLVRGRPNRFDVLFFNFPGDGPRNWKGSYRPEYEQLAEAQRAAFPHAFVHPFLLDVDGGLELILQYWLFYPSNDSGMDHEGDWEHLNVAVSPRSMVEGALTESTVRQILSGEIPATDEIPDPLVIKRVDHYFHESVWPLDYSSPNVYLPRDEWAAQIRQRDPARYGRGRVWEDIRERAYVDDEETIVNTHPFGFIGADNKGLNQALEMPGSGNKDPHGTYPFPGRYANVGPGGSTDQVSQHLDIRSFLQARRAGDIGDGPDFAPGSVLALARPDRLRLLPDWERIVDIVREDPARRRAWAWMVLPIHWGYPATRSPFSGILKNFNTGNVAPPGPSYNAGWNSSGSSSGFAIYDPHAVPDIFPLQVQDNFRNDLGFLNLTVPIFLNLPPLDFLSRIVAYPFKQLLGRHEPVYYRAESVPFRFIGISTGISRQTFGEDFKALGYSPRQLQPLVQSIVQHIVAAPEPDSVAVTGGGDYIETAVGSFVQVPLYLGGRFTSENTVRNVRTTFGADIQFAGLPDYTYSADINLWEYAGSIRYSILSGPILPFVKGGYGWAWYRVENVQANGVPFDPAESEWWGPDNVFPNVWHYGVGAEFIPWKRIGRMPGGLELALRVELTRYSQGLGLDLSQVPLRDLEIFFSTLEEVPSARRVARNDLLVGFTLTF
jgi:hypothetical protein